MMPLSDMHHRPCGAARALSLVESVLSMLIISIMLVAALHTVSVSKITQKSVTDSERGVLLAQDLLSEVLQQAYEDPESPGSFGLGGDEVGDGSRALWEDVDDYDGWVASPPQAKDGTTLPDLDGWERRVSVDWVQPDDLTQVVASDQGVKRVTVTVVRDGTDAAELVAFRTSAAGSPVAERFTPALIDLIGRVRR